MKTKYDNVEFKKDGVGDYAVWEKGGSVIGYIEAQSVTPTIGIPFAATAAQLHNIADFMEELEKEK